MTDNWWQNAPIDPTANTTKEPQNFWESAPLAEQPGTTIPKNQAEGYQQSPAGMAGAKGASAAGNPTGQPATPDIRDDPYIAKWDVIDGQEYARHKNGIIYKVTRDQSGKLVENVPIVDEKISKALGGRGSSEPGRQSARAYEWTKQTPDPTVMEQVKDFGRGVKRGAVNTAGSTVRGMSARGLSDPAEVLPLLADLENARSWNQQQLADFYQRASKSLIRSPELMKQLIGGAGDLASGRAKSLADLPNLQKAFAQAIRDPRQTEAYELGKSISDWAEKNYAGDARLQGKLQTQVAEGFGSLGAFMLPAIVPGVGPALSANAGMLQGQGESLDNAIKAIEEGKPVTRKQLLDATGLGMLPGATDAIPIETLLDRIPKPKWAEALGTIGRIVGQAAIEGGQEAVQQVAQNLIAKYQYNPDQAVSEGVAESALVGSIVGGGTQAGVDAASAVSKRVFPNSTAKSDMEPGKSDQFGTKRIEQTVNVDAKGDAQPVTRVDPRARPDRTFEADNRVQQVRDRQSQAILREAGYTTDQIREMNPDEFSEALKDASDSGIEAPTREPASDIVAQVRDLADPEHDRAGVYLPRDTVEHMKATGQLANAKKAGIALDDFDGRGGVLIVRDEQAADIAKRAREQGIPMQEIVGTLTGAGSGKPASGDVVIQQRDEAGNVTRETLTTSGEAQGVMQEFQRPGRQVVQMTPDEALIDREDRAAQELAGSRKAPVKVQTSADIENAVQQVNTQPSEGQKAAGNYKHLHINVQGLDIAIENPKGSVRTGTDQDGETWETTMPAHYGRLKRTTGADGDQVDVYLGDDPSSDQVFIIDQNDLKTGEFDESKVILGTRNANEALALYENGFSDGKGINRVGNMRRMSMPQFKEWLKGDTSAPASNRPVSTRLLEPDTAPDAQVSPAAQEDASPQLDQQPVPTNETGVEAGAAVGVRDGARDRQPDQGGSNAAPSSATPTSDIQKAYRNYLKSGKTLAVEKVAKAIGTDVRTAAGLLQESAKNGVLLYTKSGKFRRIGTSSKPMGIIEALTRAGGIRDQGGELAAMDLDKKFGPGGRLVRTNGGMTLDEAREWAVENDYLDDVAYEAGVSTSSINDLLEAIRKEAAGQKQVRKDDVVEQAAIEAKVGQQTLEERFPHPYQREIFREYGAEFTEAVDRFIDTTNTTFLDWSEIEFARAAQLWEEGFDMETAMEQASVEYLMSVPDYGVAYDAEDIPYEVAPPHENYPEDALDGSEAAGTGRPEGEQPRGQEATREEGQAGKDAGEGGRAEETGVDGKPQTVIAGAEKAPEADLIKRKADEPLKPKAEQNLVMDDGLFGDSMNQGDIFDAPKDKPFDAKAWQAARDERIKASKADGNTHLDNLPDYVETMRGLNIYNVHDPKERGVVRSVANTREVIVNWADEYSAEKNLAQEVQDGRRIVRQSWLQPSDLKDYVVDTGKAKNPTPDSAEPTPPLSETRPPIAKFAQQSGMAAKNVAKLLHDLGIAEAVMQGEDFYKKIANPPYMDLIIERLPDGKGGQMLSLAHYYEQAGDLVNDGEMIFDVDKDGKLKLDKTIASGGIGWDRAPDDAFARMFAKNLLDQGFGDALFNEQVRAGEEAFKAGKPSRVPAEIAADKDLGRAWLQGWTKANLAEPVPGVSTLANPDGDPDLLRKTEQEEIRDGEKAYVENDGSTAQVSRMPEADADLAITPLIEAFRDRLMGGDGFKSISDARAFAKEQGVNVEAGTQFAKELEENIELALVLATREIIEGGRKQGRDAKTIYDRLVGLYERQPKLGVRTSTSMADQAYSTPMPLAYLAQELAGIGPKTKVFEPTAGNGALLTAAAPENVTANEVDDTRAMQLRAQGFSVTQDRLPSDRPKRVREQGKADVVIMNPPFGAVKGEDGRSIEFTSGDLTTTAIDHAIALDALEAMPDDGRAVMIVGGINNKITDTDQRQEAYNTKQKREFYRRLYSRYNVVDHFTVDGKLYERQGAGWPVDVIVIDGRGKSARRLPAADLPQQYFDWPSLKEKIDGSTEISGRAKAAPGIRGTVQPETGAAPATEPGLAVRSENDSAAVDGGWTPDVQPETDNPAPVRPGRDRGQPVDIGRLQSAPSLRDKVSARKRGDSTGAGKPAADTGTDAVAAQQPYTPASNQRSLDTLIPQNMKSAAEKALLKLEETHGNIDAFVAERLQYSAEDLKQAFSAEQIDAIGLALVNVDKNKAMVLGDQTGIGKGRVVAALLRYARLNGMTPVFVTEKPNLYGDMIRDLNDIGMPKALGRPVNAFMTNDATEVPLDDAALDWFNEAEDVKELNKAIKAGEATGTIQPVPPKRGKFLKSKTKAANEKQMDDIQSNGLGDTDIIFTTYDQLNTVRGATTPRRSFIESIMPDAVLVLDESHNAFGTTESGWGSATGKDGVPKAENRSAFVRTLASSAKAVMFSSATYAKRPDGMDLYARTDLGDAVDDVKKLGEVISKGGVPMQQIVASMLSDAGQYVRRERSFDGIKYDMESVDVDKEVYRKFVSAMQQIVAAEERLKDSDEWKDWVKEKTLEVGGGKMMDGATGNVGVTSTNFSSLMHNIVSQMLLAIKADATADAAIAAIKNGEKPVITVSNTMGAFIEKYAEENNLSYGDAIDLAFSGVVQNYLERTRRITVKIDDEKFHHTIPQGRMPSGSIEDYKNASAVIGEIGDIPISPIDYILSKIEKAGYKTGEITGRQSKINYGNGNIQEYVQRSPREIKPAGRRSILQQFNEGGIDVMLLNRAGSTGLSAHASEKFKDRRPRTMIIAQAEANIDTHMQMLGRVNRTGQVVLPRYVQLVAGIPAEARPAAVLAKKMASLSANTTASRKSAMSSDAIDFMNKYGDQVVSDVLKENGMWAAYMGIEPAETEDLARKATGKMILLTLEDQQKFLDEVQDRYTALIEHLDKTGQNELEAKFVDLKATTLNREVLKEGAGDSPFTQPAYMEEVEIDAPGLAFKPKELAKQIRENIEGLPDGDTLADLIEVAHRTARERARKAIEDVAQRQSSYIEAEVKDVKKDEAKQALRAKDNEVWQRWREVYNMVAPGSIINVTLKDGDTVPGVVLNVYRKGTAKSPAALSAWKAQIAVPDNMRDITLPFSNMFLPSDTVADDAKGLQVAPKSWTDNGKSLEGAFDRASQSGRQTRYMVTGNIVAGYEVAEQGQIMNFSDDQGNVRQGILMSARFNQEKFMEGRPVRFKTGEQVMRFMDEVNSAEVMSTDGIITILGSGNQYEIETPKARASGGRYFLNPAVRRAANDDFASVGNRMRWRGQREQAGNVITAMQEAGAVFETRSDQKTALKIIGQQAGPAPAQMRPRTLAQAPMFYSSLEKAVEAMQQPKAPKAQWMAMIRKAPGVKPEEIEWTGLEQWMAEQSGTITKDQVLDFIRANQIDVQEVVKGEVAEGMETVMRLERLTDEQLVEEGYRYFGTDKDDMRDEIERDRDMFISELATEIDQVGEFRGEAGPASEAKFSEYQLPGGENYREVLLTLPTRGLPPGFSTFQNGGNWGIVFPDGTRVGGWRTEQDAIDSQRNQAASPDYRSGHWDEPNVLAHVRFNERMVDAPYTAEEQAAIDARKAAQPELDRLYKELGESIEAARRERDPMRKARMQAVEARMKSGEITNFSEYKRLMEEAEFGQLEETPALIRQREVYEKREALIKSLPPEPKPRKVRTLLIEEIQSDWHQAGRKKGYRKDGGDADQVPFGWGETGQASQAGAVPDAPFKTTWPELAFKRMLRYAVDNGFDRIAWTPGDVQAERYDLSKQISRIVFEDNSSTGMGRPQMDGPPSKGILRAYDLNNKKVIDQYVEPDQLPDYIGKEAADKLLSTTPTEGQSAGLGMRVRQLSGIDLKVGGEGMRGFYDQILPKAVNKMVKKWGGKVRTSEIGTKYEVVAPSGKIIAEYSSEILAQRTAMQIGDGVRFRRKKQEVWSLDLTDAMRGEVKKGLPLFQQPAQRSDNPLHQRIIPAQEMNKLAGELQKIAERVLGRSLREVKYVSEMPNGNFGSYDFLTATIKVAMQAPMRPDITIRHEAIHALRRSGVITRTEYAVLERQAARWRRKYDIDTRYGPYIKENAAWFDTERKIEEVLNEEAIAEAFSDYFLDRTEIEDSRVRKIFDRIIRFIEQVRNMLDGYGYTSASQIFADIEEGRIGQRTPRAQAPSTQAVYATEERRPVRPATVPTSTMATEPQLMQTSTETDAFKAWFGDSKVVDADGKPLVVYRGMTQPMAGQSFTMRDGGTYGEGIYLTTKPDDASFWANPEGTGETPTVYPVYVSIKKPAPEAIAEQVEAQTTADRQSSIAALEAMGYDGIVTSDGEIVAFSPTQIKSVNNRGTFDPDDARILYALPRNVVSLRAKAQQLTARASSNLADFAHVARRKMQDRFIDIKRLQEYLAKVSGQAITEFQDVYLAESLYYGRTAKRLDDLRQDVFEPLMAKIQSFNLTLDEVNDYLYARHAKERNARIASINPNMPQGGSGMTDAEADAIMAAFAKRKRMTALDDVAKDIDQMIEDGRRGMLKDGLLTQEMYDQWREYDYYVPLRGWEADPQKDGEAGRPRVGSRFDVRGKEAKAALGRRSKADNPLAYVMMQVQQGVIRGEKNRVSKTFLRLVQGNPDKTMWEIHPRKRERFLNKTTGLVQERWVAEDYGDDILTVKIGGNPTFIKIKDPDIAKAMKGLGADNMGAIGAVLHKFNRYLAFMSTQANPEFVISNLARDLQTATINLAGAEVKGLQAAVLRDIPKAMKGVWQGQRGDRTGDWARYYHEFADAGGKIGFFGLEDIETQKKQMQKELQSLQPGMSQKAWNKAYAGFKLIGDVNQAVENALRLSTYVNARKAGITKAKAASLARELTVNFNRRGEWGTMANALYLFYNAGIQGTVRMMQALKHKKVRRLVYGVIGSAFMLDIFNRWMAGDDDDDGENFYDKIPFWEKERNIIIMLPGGEGKYAKFPLPWGYNVFHVMGQQTAAAMFGKETAASAAFNVGKAGINAFNPIGGSERIARMLSPTILDPFVDLNANQDYLDRKIMPEDFPGQTPKPDSQKYWNTINPQLKWIAETMNELTGGNEVRPGTIDVSPETLQYWTEFAAGGVGAFVSRTNNFATKLLRGEEIESYQVPFARRLYGSPSRYADMQGYYDLRDEVRLVEAEFKLFKERGMRDEIAELRKRPEFKMINTIKETDNTLRQMRKTVRELRADENMKEEIRDKKIETIENRMVERMNSARKIYNERKE